MKRVEGVYGNPRQHWVGDGFPVRSLFSYHSHGKDLSPFLLLDHAAPTTFAPAARPRGVGAHPHRGFETVTIVYQGELEHRDSTGAGGKIGPGDVQWMTAGRGVVHEEFHSRAFTERGGTLEMVQLWVNLPARHKMVEPAYQTLLRVDIPELTLPSGSGRVRVIAGAFDGQRGPARTFTPVDVWDMRLNQAAQTQLDIAEGRTLALVVLHGSLVLDGGIRVGSGRFALFSRDGRGAQVQAEQDATVLVLSGEPIDEPIVGHGPFVMNTWQEIEQAMRDFASGRFGTITA
jgi:redox-sensitive bicupin YhaK (pirin superfamily)